MISMPGYLPASRNMLNSAHWTYLHREKQRTGVALLNTLNITGLCSLSTLSDPVTGTIIAAKNFKICSLQLESYLRTTGALSKAPSSLKRLGSRKKKKPSLK